jgi:hypothetical protein
MALRPDSRMLGAVLALLMTTGMATLNATRAEAAFTFAAAGDFNQTSETGASLASLATSGTDFFLALGDLSYGNVGEETIWCDFVKSYVGSSYPFELISGNHEEDNSDGFIRSFAACLPDHLGSTGDYAVEYYFDYQGLVRVIMIAPNLTISGVNYEYTQGNSHYNWLSSKIDEARAQGIKWVVVGMHKVCITMGEKDCEIGSDLMNLLTSKRVDLVLQGHDHVYERSKQLTCVTEGSFSASCVADDGADDAYTQGAGTVFVVAGMVGTGLYTITTGDAEAGYFAKWMGDNINPTHGYLKFAVSQNQISAQFVRTSGGSFSDSFTITSGGGNPPDTVPPAVVTTLRPLTTP